MKKDLTVEVRSLEILSTTVFFALTVVFMFSFGLVVEGRPLEDVAAAILWIAIAFSGTLALGRIFERERQNDTLRALLLAPADRPALYTGKILGLLLLLALVEVILVPLIGLLFGAPVFAHGLMLAGTCWPRARSASRRSGRCLRRCWSAPAVAMCCCRSCCIP